MKEILKKHSNDMVNQFIGETVDAFQERSIFKETMATDENLVIIGLRRIGKTQLLKEMTKKYSKAQNMSDKIIQLDVGEMLVEKALKNVFIIKFDSIDFIRYLDNPDKVQQIFIDLKELIREEKINLLLIDEIQVINKWTYYLKDIVDTFAKEDFRMIVTGSNSKELLDSSEMGIGRFQPRIFGVLSYNEAQKIHGDLSLADYMNYKHFPHYDEAQYNEEVPLAIVEKAFSSTKNKKTTLYKVLISIIDNLGSETNQTNVSKHSQVNKTHVRDYISGLKQSQLIFEVKNTYAKSPNSKFYPLIPGANQLFDRNKEFSIASDSDKGQLFENFVLIQLLSGINSLHQRINVEYFRNKQGEEVDFIINNQAIEVKYTKEIKNVNHYIKICADQGFDSLNFVYLGESKQSVNGSLTINYINWKDIDSHGFK